MPHNENSSPQIHTFMIRMDEHLAAPITVQFDLPDVTEVADSCGIVWHK